MPELRNHIKREVRRTRHLWARIKVQDRSITECRVMDISDNGAKIAAATSASIPDRFELAFAQGGQTRSCEVIWRHSKIFGIKLAW
jgi:PilZ domain